MARKAVLVDKVYAEERKTAIIGALDNGLSLREAISAASIHRRTYLKYIAEDEVFAKEIRTQLDARWDDLEHEAYKRAKNGDNAMLRWALKANRTKYKETDKPDSDMSDGIKELADAIRASP